MPEPRAELVRAPVSGRPRTRAQMLPILAGLAAVAIWAATPSLVKLSVAGVPVAWFVLLRYAATAVLLAGWIPSVVARAHQVKLRTWVLAIVPGIAHVFLQASSLQSIPVSWYVLGFSLSPLVTFLLLRRALSRGLVASLLVAAAGTVAFVVPAEMRELPAMLGLVELAGSVAAWVAVTVAVVQLHPTYGDVQIATILTVATLAGAVVAFVLQGAPLQPTSPRLAALIVAQALLVPAGFALFSFAVRKLPVFGIASQYLELVFGIGIAWWLFDERLAPRQLAGCTLVLAGLFLVSRLERRQVPA